MIYARTGFNDIKCNHSIGNLICKFDRYFNNDIRQGNY